MDFAGGFGGRGPWPWLPPRWLYWLTVLTWCMVQALDQDGGGAFVQQRDNAVLPRRKGHKFRKDQQQHRRDEGTKNGEPKRPNIVLFLTDDQDIELGSLNYMEKTKKLLRDEGVEFRHAYSTTPMCCPSRSSLLSGLYSHNHEVFTNNDNCSGPVWRNVHEPRTFATYLSNEAEYHTGYFGKYLNKYNGSHVPPGWDQWGGLIMNSKYYNYSVNLNGKKIKHGDDYHEDYYPNLVTNDSIEFLRNAKLHHPNRPFMLMMSFPSPHGPEDSAPEYSDMFFNVTSHHTPTYDYAPNPDKQWILRITTPMTPIQREFTDMLMTKRLQTLQSVDEAVSRVYEELKQLGELENTYIVYTSDHGYHLGQFGLVKGKSFPFEFDVRVPMLVRGPGIEPGTQINEIFLNIDLAPTFLDIAGVVPPPHMDGRSAFKLFHKHKKGNKKFVSHWPDTFLIESSGRRDQNKHKKNFTVPPLISSYDDSVEGGVRITNTKASKMFMLCHRPDFQTPCKPGQKWHCTNDGYRWRKQKCNPNKNRKQLLNGLKKCTCFTADGNLYTKLIMDKNAKSNSKSSKLSKHKDRFRRDVLTPLDSNMTSIMNTINKQIDVLQTEANVSSTASCHVTPNGDVKCMNIVYNNPKVWKFSQNRVEKLILSLQVQLEKLKEIQKHLETIRPNFQDDDKENNDGDDQEEEDSVINLLTDLTQSQFHHRTIHNNSMGPDGLLVGGTEPHRSRHHHGHKKIINENFENLTTTADADTCECTPYVFSDNDPMLNMEVKRLLKGRGKKKKGRKFRKKNSKLSKECMYEKMNCFNHDNDHWRTAPFWTRGPFCFCMNSNNNTYNCLRTINSTHNYLYCEFVTGVKTFYNLKVDAYQKWNRYQFLLTPEKDWLHNSLAEMMRCKGSTQCAISPVKRRKKLDIFDTMPLTGEAITSKRLLMDQPKDADIERLR